MIYHIRSAENVGVFENYVTVVLSTKTVGHELVYQIIKYDSDYQIAKSPT